jgi:hypothetical protein
MKFWEKHKKEVINLSIIISLGLIAWLGYDLYTRGKSVGVDWSLAIIAFWISSAIFFMSLYSNSRIWLVIRSIAIYILAGISIYVSMGLKFDIEKMKQIYSKNKIEKIQKITNRGDQ